LKETSNIFQTLDIFAVPRTKRNILVTAAGWQELPGIKHHLMRFASSFVVANTGAMSINFISCAVCNPGRRENDRENIKIAT
jgi:hypothetical protein